MSWLVDLLAGTVLPRVARIAALLSLGVFLANLAVAAGAVERVAGLSKYLTDPANLPRAVGTAILATTASPTAGYGMLAEFRESGAIDDRATLVAVTINTVFGFLQHVFTFYLPVLIPILGLEVGLLYVGARAAISLGITLAGVGAGSLLLSPANVDESALGEVDYEADGGGETRRAMVREAADSTREQLRSILPRLVAVYAVVAVLIARWETVTALARAHLGVSLPALAAAVGGATELVGLPGAAAPVVAVVAVDTTNGAIVLAPLVANGTIGPRAAVATLLVGGLVSLTVSTFKRSIPFQYGIWGAAFGSKVIAVNVALKAAFILAALVVLLG